MSARVGYCRSCYREVPDGAMFCVGCTAKQASVTPAQKIVIVLGLAAIPVLFTGIGTLNPKLCLIGVAIAAIASLTYAVLSLRS